ncbi:MAG TPA: alpha/beta fold hydrolase [Smithella sp.]|nr:alpha/beta fold hydrolase [Smithella sp.]
MYRKFKPEAFIRFTVIIAMLFLLSGGALAQDNLKIADLGDYTLENGQVIRDCRLAYRTFGDLNSTKSNVILFPTWLAGTTQDLVDLGLIGPGKTADSSKYFIIAVDAFGNGVSSSPSNSKSQPDQLFPRFSIKDMVNAQHLLLTQYLHLPRAYGVIGISMGAMMAYQWMVSYPDFFNKAVAVVGTPRLTSYDLLLWQSELSAIDADRERPHGENKAMKTVGAIHNLHLRTPHYIVTHTTPEAFPQFLAEMEKSFMKRNEFDWACQLKAVMDHDIYRSFGEAIDPAAKTIRAKALIIWAQQDLTVNPEPAKEIAGYLHADTFEFSGDCGHLSFLCEGDALRDAVKRFMQ